MNPEMTPQQSASILSRMFGYQGPVDQNSIDQFLASNPAAAARMGKYKEAMTNMVSSQKPMNFQAGGSVANLQAQQQKLVKEANKPLQTAGVATISPASGVISGQPGAVTGATPTIPASTVASTTQAVTPTVPQATTYTPTTATTDVQAETAGLQAAQGQITPQGVIEAAQQATTSVEDVKAAQGTAVMMDNPVQREIQQGELISGAADAAKAATFTEQVQAAEATPSKQATVAGQLEDLMQDFEGGETPSWAAGAMRSANQMLVSRGLGASSVAGQAVIQAAMEAALPIAQIDAQTQAQFEAQNLSNRQQRAILAAQQRAQFIGQEFDQAFQSRVANSARIGEIANLNFTAEQQIALENSRAANTVNLQNLSNKQAVVMAEAAALAQLDIANLNNRQQAAVQNAQNFLSMDMANLNNEQQATMFKAQQNIQAIFTDQAAENASAQFNATSENQRDQFFANLTSQASQFNASQSNAMKQFNAGQEDAAQRFNAEMVNQRQMFNAQNALIVAQANAQWRQNVSTLEFAAKNEANMQYAKAQNALSTAALDQIWQRERDIMSYAFTASESELDRATEVLLADKSLESVREQLDSQEETARASFWFQTFTSWN